MRHAKDSSSSIARSRSAAESYPPALFQAAAAGLDPIREPDAARLREEIESADVVQLHYWNNPDVAELLHRDLPSMRLLVWLKIVGRHAPQVLTGELVDFADRVVATTPETLSLAVAARSAPEVLPGIGDPDRLGPIEPRPHEGFNVGYVGTVNYSKMHPEFVAMSAAVSIPGVRFVVCGADDGGAVQAEVARHGAAERFRLLGFVEDLRFCARNARRPSDTRSARTPSRRARRACRRRCSRVYRPSSFPTAA